MSKMPVGQEMRMLEEQFDALRGEYLQSIPKNTNPYDLNPENALIAILNNIDRRLKILSGSALEE